MLVQVFKKLTKAKEYQP